MALVAVAASLYEASDGDSIEDVIGSVAIDTVHHMTSPSKLLSAQVSL